MSGKPTYAELQQRVTALEDELAEYRRQSIAERSVDRYLQVILDNTNLPIYLKDRDYRYILINREFERLALVSNKDIQGKTDFDIFPPSIARLFREQDEETVESMDMLEFTETIELADGEHTFLTAKFPVVDDAGQLQAVGGVCTDITALGTAERKLRESESRYRSFLENFHGIAYRLNLSSSSPDIFDGAVEAITGYSGQELIARNPSWGAIIHPEDKQAVREDHKLLLRSAHSSYRREYRIITKDGSICWIFERGELIRDEQGKPVWLEGTLHDITPRKTMEAALRESELKYRTLVETASAGIQISDPDGRIVFSNPAHHAIHGMSAGEIVGMSVWDFIDDEEEKQRLQGYYHHIITQQPVPETYITSNRTRDGRDIVVQVDWNYIRDDEGQLLGICAIIHDITVRVKAEEALKAGEQRFRSVIESCPEGIHMYTLQPDGRLVFSGANPAADAILGLDHRQFMGKTLEEAFPASMDTEVPDRYRQVCRNGTPWHADQVVYEDQHIKGVFEIHAFQTEPYRMAVFFNDVTAKRRMEEELQKNQKLESVGILAGGLAHDFNNLLTAILGNISMARLFAQSDLDKVMERLIDAEKASIRARDLTQQLLTFSKGGAPVKSAASIGEIIKDSASFMLSGSNVRCDLMLPPDLWPVNIDSGQISQVVQNVIKNADQAMPDGGKITVQAENVVIEDKGLPLEPGRYVLVSVADQGVGIAKKHLSRIFDPYFSTKQEGSGLGLAAAHSIVKNHDGLLTAESELGRGTTFYIYLPATAVQAAAKPLPERKNFRSGAKILVMDDEEAVLEVAGNMLSLMGYRVETAGNGADAIACYKRARLEDKPFDLVILDLTIPGGLGGLETLQQLAAIDPGVKAIVSSGYANDPVMADFRAYGFMGVITKPYDMDHLGRALADLFP